MSIRKMIVAVDDSGVVLKKLEIILQKRYDFKGFSVGQRALEFLGSNTADLIVLDIDMPDINGFELLKKIRKIDDLKDVPVMFLTANASKSNVIYSAKAGASDYAIKPLDEKVIVEKVAKLVEGAGPQ